MKSFVQIEGPYNESISVVINEADTDEKQIAIIMCYGMNGNRVCQHRLGVKLERELENLGVSLIRFDYENVGTSTGFFEASTIRQRIFDLEKVYDYVKYNLNYHKVYLLGFSDGARNVMQSQLKSVCDGLILWNPILGGVESEKGDKGVSRMILHPFHRIAVKELLGVGINMQMLAEMKKDKSVFEIENINKPCMIVFGGGDSLSKDVQKYVQEKNLSFLSVNYIEDADHLFNRKTWEEKAIKCTCDFVGGSL